MAEKSSEEQPGSGWFWVGFPEGLGLEGTTGNVETGCTGSTASDFSNVMDNT